MIKNRQIKKPKKSKKKKIYYHPSFPTQKLSKKEYDEFINYKPPSMHLGDIFLNGFVGAEVGAMRAMRAMRGGGCPWLPRQTLVSITNSNY